MEYGPAQNLRNTPSRRATAFEKQQSEISKTKKVLKDKLDIDYEQAVIVKKKKRPRNKSRKTPTKSKKEIQQPSVRGYLLAKQGTDENQEQISENNSFFKLPVALRIRRLENGYLTDPEITIRRKKNESNAKRIYDSESKYRLSRMDSSQRIVSERFD